MKGEKILWAVKVGDPDHMEQIITTNPDHIYMASIWAKAHGFDRLRVSVIDMGRRPDFTKTIHPQ